MKITTVKHYEHDPEKTVYVKDIPAGKTFFDYPEGTVFVIECDEFDYSAVGERCSDDEEESIIYSDPPEQHVRILLDCLRLMESTTNPGTYFYRYKLAQIEASLAIGHKGIIWKGMNVRQIENMLNRDFSRDLLHRKFIDHLFSVRREDRLLFMLPEVSGNMSASTIAYFKQKLGNKKYRFCRVRFNDISDKLYTYISEDNSITIGDTVTVNTGNGYTPEIKEVRVVEAFYGSVYDLDFPIEKLRSIEKKVKSMACPHCGAPLKINPSEKMGKCTECQAEIYFV